MEGEKMQPMTNEQKVKISLSKRTKNGIEKILVNKDNGIFYDTLQEAADSINMKKTTLSARLRGQIENNSNIIYV